MKYKIYMYIYMKQDYTKRLIIKKVKNGILDKCLKKKIIESKRMVMMKRKRRKGEKNKKRKMRRRRQQWLEILLILFDNLYSNQKLLKYLEKINFYTPCAIHHYVPNDMTTESIKQKIAGNIREIYLNIILKGGMKSSLSVDY